MSRSVINWRLKCPVAVAEIHCDRVGRIAFAVGARKSGDGKIHFAVPIKIAFGH